MGQALKRSQRHPEWTRGASPVDAFLRGLLGAPSVPVLVVFVTFVGFGALAHDVGLDIFQAIFVSATVFALPNQVVLVDSAAKGAGLAAVAFAVALTSVRLLPMTFSLFPVMRSGRAPRWAEFILSHFVAITVWLESMRRLPRLPRALRVPYFAGFALVMLVGLMAATAFGYVLSANVPPAIAAGMVFLTPIYFFLSLIETARNNADKTAIVAGAVLGPLLFTVLPGLDLLLTGLVGGTAAYALMKWRQAGGGDE